MPDTHDSEFSWDDFQVKVNNELVSALGNYYHRCLSFTKKNFSSIPAETDGNELGKVMPEIEKAFNEYNEHMENCDLKKAIKTIMELARYGNRYFDSGKPWALVKENKEECGAVLNASLQIVKALAIMSWPFMPSSSERITGFMNIDKPLALGLSACTVKLPAGTELEEPVPVYAKVDIPKADEVKKDDGPVKKDAPLEGPFADFRRLDIRVAEIIDAKDHPDAEKLFVLKVNAGEERQIVAGLRAYYKAEELIGRKVLMVMNLKPAKLRGMMSQGMLLAADDEELGGNTVVLLKPTNDVPNGTKFNCGLETNESEIEFKDFQKAVIKVFTVNGKAAATVIDGNDKIPLSDGKGCFAAVDRELKDGANVR
jgi:methionyl-tRNA synthetase